jgi:methylglutaconyl-CoA hydratase
MKDYQTIAVDNYDHVLTISLNRPEKHNALNAEMIAELSKVFIDIQTNNDIRVVVLRGKGKSFCAGADLNYMKDVAAFGEGQNYDDALRLAQLFENIYTCPKPVIAVAHGLVFGGANGLTAACDIVLAEDNTVFAFSEVKLGISPATISPYVIRRCGEAAARELMLSGRRFTAFEAFRYQLVNRTYELANQDELLQYYVNEFKTAAPNAIASCKKLISEVASNETPRAELMKKTASLIAAQRASDEGQEGMKAFFEKRKPNWSI